VMPLVPVETLEPEVRSREEDQEKDGAGGWTRQTRLSGGLRR